MTGRDLARILKRAEKVRELDRAYHEAVRVEVAAHAAMVKHLGLTLREAEAGVRDALNACGNAQARLIDASLGASHEQVESIKAES